MPVGGSKRTRAALAGAGRPKRRHPQQASLSYQDSVGSASGHGRLETPDTTAVLENLLGEFRRSVVVESKQRALANEDIKTEIKNVSPVRLTLVSILRQKGLSAFEIRAMRDRGEVFCWRLPTSRSDMAAAATNEIDAFVCSYRNAVCSLGTYMCCR